MQITRADADVDAPVDAHVAERARLLRIEDTRRDEPAFVDSLLASASSSVRVAAARTAGRIGGGAHRAALRVMVESEDPDVASGALFALAMLKDTASMPLAARTLRRTGSAAIQAAWLLGELGEAARSALVAALGDASIDPATRRALLLASARLRAVPSSAIAPWVASQDSGVAWRAAYALARGHSAAGVRVLLGASSSPWAAVREQAARGLGRAVAGDSLAGPAIAALRTLVDDVDPHVRVGAVRALASYRGAQRATVVQALHDRDPGVRLTAAQSLDLVLDSAASSWRGLLAVDTAFVVQRTIAEAAARRGHRVVDVDEWRTSPEWQRRAAFADIEAIGSADSSLERVASWMHEADARVRAAAIGSVARLADSASTRVRARTILLAALRDDDFQVRATALAALASGATATDLAAALDAHRQFSDDRDADARLAFWQLADSALRGRRPLPDSIETRLALLQRPADPLERAAAAAIPRFAAWRDVTGVARPLAWYVDRAREFLVHGPRVTIGTERGTMDLDLFGSDAPLTVYNFVALARSGYFDGLRFHRVVPGFVVQGGDPRGDGNGGPGYAIRDEINPRRYLRGTLGMALSGPNTGGSQFFITLTPQPHLDGGYTVFGQLVAGGDVLDRIVQGDRIVRVTIH